MPVTRGSASAKLLAALASLVALLAAGGAGAQPVPAGERARLLAGGVVEPALVDALDRADRVAVLVVLEGREYEAGALARLAAGEGRVRRRYGALPTLALEVAAPGLARLADAPGVVRVGPDLPVAAQLAQGVPLVHLDLLQEQGAAGGGVTVAILDTGIDTDHPSLAAGIVAQRCFCDVVPGAGCCPNGNASQSGAGAAEDNHGHGTRVAGVIRSTHPSATGGAPDSSIVAVKVLDAAGNGMASDILAGLDWILTDRPEVDVVNMSLGGGAYAGDCDDADATTMSFADAIALLHARDTLVVAGSGNNNYANAMIMPACVAQALSVGAVWDANVGSQAHFGCTDSTTQADQITCWSNQSTTTDVFAPGALTTSTNLGGSLATVAGTSYATPLASACAAALLSAVPGTSADDLTGALRTSPTIVNDGGGSHPRLDCLAALHVLAPPVPALPNAGAAVPLLALGLAAAGAFALRTARARR
jgi:subtilisin family serine protease